MNLNERLEFLIKRKNNQYKYLFHLKVRLELNEIKRSRYNEIKESADGVLENIIKEIGKINKL